MSKIGFIGLGHMGYPMAYNLIKAGHSVFVYDVMPELINDLAKEGAHAGDSLETVARHTEVIITSVQTGEQVDDICLRKNGLFKHMSAEQLFIDCSSIDITTSQLLHQKAQELGLAMLDAPVSGGVAGAKAATLAIMVGGETHHFERALPILQVLGKKIVHAGNAGMGQAAKICNNLLLAISMIGASEAFTLAKKLGLDAKKFFEISANASSQCWSITSYCPVPGILENAPSSHGYKAGFMSKMMLKDLRLAQHAAESVSAVVPLGSVATELYELFVTQGFGEKDFSAIITLLDGSN